MADDSKPEGWLLRQFAVRWSRWILATTAILYVISLLVILFVGVFPAFQSATNWTVLLGAFWLGALIGTLLGFYVQEAEIWALGALTGSVSAVTSSGVIAFLQYINHDTGAIREVWFYPIGLVGGFIVGTLWEHADPPQKAPPK